MFIRKNITFWQKLKCLFGFHNYYNEPFNENYDKSKCFYCYYENIFRNLNNRGYRYCENCGEREDKCPCSFWYKTC